MHHHPDGLGEPWTYSINLPNDPRAPRVARCTVRTVLALYGLEQLSEATELLASELVTNTVRHTGGPSLLRLHGWERRLRMGVWDTDPTIPAPFDKPPALASCPVQPGEEHEDGRGLGLVRVWAHDWGAYPVGDELYGTRGKLLWVELSQERADFDIAA